MIVYNIRRDKYSKNLNASGIANRWNKDEEFVVYTGGSIALSTLELVAHRNAIDVRHGYKLLFIKLDIKDNDITEIKLEGLSADWKSINHYPKLQELGSNWYQSNSSLILKVPSALVHWESNYLINTKHPDFSDKVSLLSTEDFEWDGRLL